MARRFGTYVNRDFYVPLHEHKKLQQELSLAEEGLANYAQDLERVKNELHHIRNAQAEWVLMCKCGCPACMALLESFRDAIPQSEPPSG